MENPTLFPLHLPCIRVSQPLGDFFLCSINAGILKTLAYSIPATADMKRPGIFKFRGNQRQLSPKRATEIGAYIDNNEATFPNSLILGVNYDKYDNYEEDENYRWNVVERTDGCLELVIPSNKQLASIIDGQHRLAGFEFAKKSDRIDMQLPCAIFLDLPKAFQADIFATINFNQKPVDRSLAYELFGYELEEKNKEKWPPSMLALFIARVLNTEPDSPFVNHIKLALADSVSSASTKTSKSWVVSIATVIEGIGRLITSNQAKDKNLLLSGEANTRQDLPVGDRKTPLRELYLHSEDKKLFEILSEYFSVVKLQLWNSANEKSFIIRTVGIQATFDILRIALDKKVLDPNDISGSSLAMFAKLPPLDFSDNFFHASGAGRTRIRNSLAIALGLMQYDELKSEVMESGIRAFLKKS